MSPLGIRAHAETAGSRRRLLACPWLQSADRGALPPGVMPPTAAQPDMELLTMLEAMLDGLGEAQPSMPLSFMHARLEEYRGVRVRAARARAIYSSLGTLGVEVTVATPHGEFSASACPASRHDARLRKLHLAAEGHDEDLADGAESARPLGSPLRSPSSASLGTAGLASPGGAPLSRKPSRTSSSQPTGPPPRDVLAYDTRAHAAELITPRVKRLLDAVEGCEVREFPEALADAVQAVAKGTTPAADVCLTPPPSDGAAATPVALSLGAPDSPPCDPLLSGLPPDVHSGMYGVSGLLPAGVDPVVLFALSVAALRAVAAARPIPRPLWALLEEEGGFVGVPRTMPCPVVTLFEGSALNGSPLPIQEIAVAVYTSSIAKALSYAREIAERVRPKGGCAIGVRGGFVPKRPAPLAALLEEVQQAVRVVLEPCDRAKVFAHFGSQDGGFCNTYMGAGKGSFSVMDNMKAGAQAGSLDAVIDPFHADLVDGWGVANMLGLATCVDNVVDVAPGFSARQAEIPVDVAFVNTKLCRTAQDAAAFAKSLLPVRRQHGPPPPPDEGGGAAAAAPAAEKLLMGLRADAYEPGDTYLADLALAVRADFVMFGGLFSGERTALYNALLRIEDRLAEAGTPPYTPVPERWL